MTDNFLLGYACINIELNTQKKKITTNRGMIKRTFAKKGIEYASELARLNVLDLHKILVWNKRHDVRVFRMSSCLFPWSSEYELSDLPDYEEICAGLKTAGQYARDSDIRLSFHPGPFNILASPKENVVKNAINDLNTHGTIMDIMGMPRSQYAKINIHVGASYGDREGSMARFCDNFKLLSESAQSRLTVENDDRANLYSTRDLYEGVYKKIGIPIVFDFHHHKFCSGDQTEREALETAIDTWGKIIPTCHYSESAALKEGKKKVLNAHSDYIYDRINNYNHRLDIVIEAKAKEKALFKYLEDWGGKNESKKECYSTCAA